MTTKPPDPLYVEWCRGIDETSKRLRAEMRHREFAPDDCPCAQCAEDRKRAPGDVSEWIVGADTPPSLFAPKPGLADWTPHPDDDWRVRILKEQAHAHGVDVPYRAPLPERVTTYLRGVWRALRGER